MREARRAYQLDPLTPNFWSWIGGVLELSGRTEEAIAHLEQPIPGGAEHLFHFVHLRDAYMDLIVQGVPGSFEKALAADRKAAAFVPSEGEAGDAMFVVAFLHYLAGDEETAEKLFADSLNTRAYVPPRTHAYWAELHGDWDACLEWLEKGIEDRDVYTLGYRLFHPRSWPPDPRVDALLDAQGLP